MKLWTEKHRPVTTEGIAGQGKAVAETKDALERFKPGKALFLCGPPGSGKTLLVETLARERELLLLQLNASDFRKSGDIESFSGATSTRPLFSKGKLILLDEVDGVSGRSDRGAVPSIVKLVKKSRYPVFLIANDPWKPKLSPLRQCSKLIKFTKVPGPSIEKRLREICEKEGITPEDGVLKNLARWSQGDMRSAITDLQIISHGRQSLCMRDMEALGYRERESQVYDILPTIFNSRKISASRKLIHESDKDPDELLWWLETNALLEFRSPEELARAYDILSRADMFRALVMKQQNWRFKGFMVDMMSGISLSKREPEHRYVPYKPPERLILMGRTKIKRALMKSASRKIGSALHCSSRTVKEDYLPYLKIIMRKNRGIAGELELEPEEAKLLA